MSRVEGVGNFWASGISFHAASTGNAEVTCSICTYTWNIVTRFRVSEHCNTKSKYENELYGEVCILRPCS